MQIHSTYSQVCTSPTPGCRGGGGVGRGNAVYWWCLTHLGLSWGVGNRTVGGSWGEGRKQLVPTCEGPSSERQSCWEPVMSAGRQHYPCWWNPGSTEAARRTSNRTAASCACTHSTGQFFCHGSLNINTHCCTCSTGQFLCVTVHWTSTNIAVHVPLVSYLCHSSLNIKIHCCTCIMGLLFVSQFNEHQKILLYLALVNALWVSYLCPGSMSIKPHCFILCLYTRWGQLSLFQFTEHETTLPHLVLVHPLWIRQFMPQFTDSNQSRFKTTNLWSMHSQSWLSCTYTTCRH